MNSARLGMSVVLITIALAGCSGEDGAMKLTLDSEPSSGSSSVQAHRPRSRFLSPINECLTGQQQGDAGSGSPIAPNTAQPTAPSVGL